MDIKTKTKAIELFGSQAELGRALGITRSAIGQWPEIFNHRQINEVLGAAIREGLIRSKQIKKTA
ncbi:MAG: Cro/CI family transcriptional regulator [Methylococcales bacterium]